MVVSLCVLRLEVADDSPSLSHIQYSAPRVSAIRMSAEPKTKAGMRSNAERRGTGKVPLEERKQQARCLYPSPSKSDLMRKHRGRRELHEIKIETLKHCEEGASESLHLTKEPAPPAISDKISRGEIEFTSGNPFVEITHGILHLFKENEMTESGPCSEMLCMLGVPAVMTTHDLLQFTAPCSKDMTNIRVIRDSTPNQYMVLIKFRDQFVADEFYKNYNGARFNSIEPEVCNLVYVSKVETTKECESGCLPLEGHTELPTCTVCLERMDESVDGILTILCNHSFHGSCLDKWGDSSCPVCRFSQTPEIVADNRCTECHSQESLWICLICGHIGCGRYVEGHAYKHFLDTQHTYAMQIGNNRVWDYAGDNYVHRLIQNKADGKLVQLDERFSVEHEEKLDSMQLEFTYLLTSQLESQRLFFEDKMTLIEAEAHRQVEQLREQAKQVAEECAELRDKMNYVDKEKQTNEKKIQQLTVKLNKVNLELIEENAMNTCLRENQSQWQAKVKELEESLKEIKESKDSEIRELKEQVRDMMFYLEAKDQIKNASEELRQEIQEGQILMDTASTSSSDAAQRRRRRKPR